MKDYSNKKFDIIILAGQSNAEGNGIHNVSEEIFSGEREYELIDKNPAYISVENGSTKLTITIPTECDLSRLKERRVGDVLAADISMTFANEYVKEFLEDGRDLLVVKAAVGGTGFEENQWGIGNLLYERLIHMTDKALSLNKENRVIAMLWHQGEHEVFRNENFTPSEKHDFSYNAFKEQNSALRARYGNFYIIAGEFVNDWADKNRPQSEIIERAIKDVCNDMDKAAVASSEGLLSNDQAIKNGDKIHFSAQSIYEFGKRYYALFKELKEKTELSN